MAISGTVQQDVGGYRFMGPADVATGNLKAWRGSNVSGEYADGNVVFYDSAGNTIALIDTDTGAGTKWAIPVTLLIHGSGGGFPVPGDSANGLDVDVTRLPKGTPLNVNPATQPDTTARLIIAANANRKGLILRNRTGAAETFLGPTSGVTATGATRGMSLKADEAFTDDLGTSAWYGITAAGSGDICGVEFS